MDVDLSTLPREASNEPSLDQSGLVGEGAASPSKNSSRNSALDKMPERLDALASGLRVNPSGALSEKYVGQPARPLASGEYEDQRVEQSRRAQWIRHLVAKKQYKEAEDIGWDLEDDPRPTMKDEARRALWIKYFVDGWLFEEAVMVGWDEETPPDPRPRRIFIWTGGVYTGFDTYRCRDTVRIEGLCDEAAIVAVKVVSSMRFEIKMTVRVLAGPKAGEVKKLKIRCDKRLNFENLTKTWEQVKQASAVQRAAAAR